MRMNPFKKHKDDASEGTDAPHAPMGGEAAARAGDGALDPSANDAAAGLDTGPDETAALIAELGARIDELTRERDAARDQVKAALAEFQNYQRRSRQNEQQEREFGVRGVLQSIMPVIDHFDLALALDPQKTSAKQVIDGVTMIKDELLRVLSQHGIALVRPGRGDAFDPVSHKAIVHVPADGVPSGSVVATLRIGYAMNGRVVRPAEVSIAAATSEGAPAGTPGAEGQG